MIPNENKLFIKPPAQKITFTTSSNFNNPISLNLTGSFQYRFTNNYAIWKEYNNIHFYGRFNPRFRINNHAFFQYIFALEKENKQLKAQVEFLKEQLTYKTFGKPLDLEEEE